jgi:hypothetical protein
MRTISLICIAIVAAASHQAVAQETPTDEITVSPAARTALGITIYNDGQALVRDTRTLDLRAGRNRVAFREVAATIRPETASLKPVAGAAFALVEQNFDFDLLTPNALLKKYVGKEVTVIRSNPATGVDAREKATVLAANEGIVLRYADRIENGLVGRIAFGSVPENLRDRPTLTVVLNAARDGKQGAELMYLANQVGWKADYIASVDADGSHMTLNGWVTLTNQSGTAYENARLQLVAGTLNRVREQPLPMAMMKAVGSMARDGSAMREEKLGDYHLYTLGQPTTILNNQTKQVALLSAAAIPVRREYVLETSNAYWWYQGSHPEIQRGLKPSVLLKFENKGDDLGIPLPAGTIRVYTADRSGGAQLIGEDAIAHTARNEKIALRLGEAFDITADRLQTDYKALSSHSSQSSYRIDIRNADANPVLVTVREPMSGDWSIGAENIHHVKESAGAAVWQVTVPAQGAASLQYTATVKW